MATLVPVTVAIKVLFTRERVRQKSGHMDTPVLNVRANLHKYKMKLFPVWGQRLFDESRSGRKPPACGGTSFFLFTPVLNCHGCHGEKKEKSASYKGKCQHQSQKG